MKNKEQKVQKFLHDQLTTNKKTMDIMLLPVDENSYMLFGEYAIFNKNDWYLVCVDDNVDTERKFSTLKTAVTWCVFHQRRKILECRKIEHLDSKLDSLEIDLIQKTKVLHNTKNNDIKCIYDTKIEEDNIKKKSLLKQLNYFINISKNWQTNTFNSAKPTYKR